MDEADSHASHWLASLLAAAFSTLHRYPTFHLSTPFIPKFYTQTSYHVHAHATCLSYFHPQPNNPLCSQVLGIPGRSPLTSTAYSILMFPPYIYPSYHSVIALVPQALTSSFCSPSYHHIYTYFGQSYHALMSTPSASLPRRTIRSHVSSLVLYASFLNRYHISSVPKLAHGVTPLTREANVRLARARKGAVCCFIETVVLS